MIQIKFKEDLSSGYANRTKENASADATIAFAIDFDSAGEKLTKKMVKQQNKLYIPINANYLEVTKDRVYKIVKMLNSINKQNLAFGIKITLNIAGNGIYTMKGKYTQQQIDEFTFNLLKAIIIDPNLINSIKYIRTGGQTGFDEAGAKAASKLDIPTFVLAPKGWKFRDENGKDISNETLFKQRFGERI